MVATDTVVLDVQTTVARFVRISVLELVVLLVSVLAFKIAIQDALKLVENLVVPHVVDALAVVNLHVVVTVAQLLALAIVQILVVVLALAVEKLVVMAARALVEKNV